MIVFVFKLHNIARRDREHFIEIIDTNLVKRMDKLEHIVISKKVFKSGFTKLKKQRDLDFIASIEEKLFSKKKGF